jgi:ligand-binding SRPBCC domain-containing protein
MATTTFHLRVWTRFFEPPERVWALKTDPAALAAEFPAWAPFSVGDPAAFQGALAAARPHEGAGRLGPLPWPVALTAVQPGRGFTDTSSNALYSWWQHEHILEPTADGTRYIDAVTFTPRLPAKLSAILTQRFFVARHQRAATRLAADARTVGVSVLRVWDPEEDEPDAT